MESLTLMDQLKEFVTKAEDAGKIEKIREIVKYVNINDENDFFLSLEEAFEKRLNLSEYKKEVNIVNHKEELTKLLTTEPYLYKEDIELLEKAVKYAKKLVHRHIPEDNKSTDEKLATIKIDEKAKKKK